MVFVSICKHASSAFIFESMSSNKICFLSSKHFRKYRWQVASTLEIFLLSIISLIMFFNKKSCFAPSNLADSFRTGQ